MLNIAPFAIAESQDRATLALRQVGLVGQQIAAPFPLWLVAVPDRLDPDLLALLTEDEHARAARFVGDRLQQRYLAAHGALRVLGECYFGVPAAEQEYRANAFGKPYLSQSDAQCSISYSGAWVLVAWSRESEIGVDLEVVRHIEDADDLVAIHCTQAERRELGQSEDGGARRPLSDQAFLGVWTRKEACMKAMGKGFAIPPSSFDCGTGPGISDVQIEGHRVECGNYDLKGDLAVAWARLRRAA